MGLDTTTLGEIVQMGNLVQRNVNEHSEALNKLQPLLKRLSTLAKPTPKDEYGDDLTDEQLAVMVQKTKVLYKKCKKYLPITDSSDATPKEK